MKQPQTAAVSQAAKPQTAAASQAAKPQTAAASQTAKPQTAAASQAAKPQTAAQKSAPASLPVQAADKEAKDYNIRSVERALNALQCFNGELREISLMEFSRMLSLNKSTTFRILTTLRNLGFLETAENGKYKLGAEMSRLGRLIDSVSILKRESQPVMEKLAELSGETLAICKYENGRMTCISKIESEKVLKCICVLDSDVPMLKGATGRCALAYLSEEELKRCIKIQRMIGNPECRYEELTQVLAKIREAGYYISHSEYDENVNALGVPIFGKGGEVIGSLSIVGPDSRFADDAIIKILPEVIRETQTLSRRLGYDG